LVVDNFFGAKFF